MSNPQSILDEFVVSPEDQRLLAQESAILEVTELICRIMERESISKAELARRLGKSRAFVTQFLDGSTNMTLKSISDVLHAMGCSLRVSAQTQALDGTAHKPLKKSRSRKQIA